MDELQIYIDSRGSTERKALMYVLNHVHSKHHKVKIEMMYKMPAIKANNGTYIAIGANKSGFSVHCKPYELLDEVREDLPKGKFGVGCVRLRYTDKEALDVICRLLDEFVCTIQNGTLDVAN